MGGPLLALGLVIIAYLFPQERVLDPAEVAADKLTHVNYAFANIKDGKVGEGFSHDAENFKGLGGLRKRPPQCRILVSLGRCTCSGSSPHPSPSTPRHR